MPLSVNKIKNHPEYTEILQTRKEIQILPKITSVPSLLVPEYGKILVIFIITWSNLYILS